ncbi:MAG: TfoX/Sxy family protein [Solirubrobacterales bacterium]
MSDDMLAYYEDLFAPLGVVETKRMFSGAGFSAGGFTFALLLRAGLYMRVDDVTRPAYEAAGCEPFTYTARGKEVVVRRYYSAPDDAVESAERMSELALESLAAAQRDDVRKKR